MELEKIRSMRRQNRDEKNQNEKEKPVIKSTKYGVEFENEEDDAPVRRPYQMD